MPETSDIFSQPTEVPITHQQENCPPVSEQKIKKFALIGYPLGHSMSEYIHLAGFKSVGINATYEIIPTPPEELSDRIKYLRSNGYSGFNVTIPLKLPVSLFLDEIDPSAGIVNAINTVVIDPNTNALRGYNTDVKGFISAIPSDFPLYNKTVAILGTGGAARAAITALAQKQVKEFRIYTRNIANSLELIDYLRKTFSNITFNSYQIDKFKDFSDVNLLVNATPIGMSGSTVGYSPAEEDELRTLPNDALIYDVVYNPKKTNLIRLAQKLNLKCINGVDMLVWQAYEAQKIWTGRTPDFKDMKIALLENL
ncbi:shikimate dehydrogenase [bacterium]|nr:shikimate dehydrogenase [bacterium]